MEKLTFILLLILLASGAGCQNPTKFFSIEAKISDISTNEVLPYATVFNKQQSNGTASNSEGYFVLPDNRIGDTVLISYLGYEDRILVLSEDLPDTIQLNPYSTLLNEVVITAKSDYLYKLISQLKKKKKTKTKSSKTYFFLESKIFNETVEIIESYYNGEYANLGLNDLYIKKGRIGLKPHKNRYFRSTESSRLFSMHRAFESNKLFPENPLSLGDKALRRSYVLDLKNRYEENESEVFVIEFTPKDNQAQLFNGTIWIDKTNGHLLKLVLRIKNSQIHPFVPIGFNTIEEVDMEITKSYEKINGEPFISSLDFNYDVQYTDTLGNEFIAHTIAFIKAFDFNKTFQLPYFDYTRHYHEDYRNITATPCDTFFWKHSNEFRFFARQGEIDQFISKHQLNKGILHPESKRDSALYQLQFPYISWESKRFKMRQASFEIIEKSKRSKPFEIDRYSLGTKIYLDINQINDSLTYQLYSILDPVESYYHFLISNQDLAFMNMYFDLTEIQKRRLDKKLKVDRNPSIESVKREYDQHIQELEEMQRQFIGETSRGKNMQKMIKWNQYIHENLGVDNLDYFKLEVEVRDP